MSEAWKQWEGQVVDRRFPLRQYLGGSDHGAVFLTEHGERDLVKAAIKVIPADPASAEIQLSRWKHAAQLFHPHLLRLFEMGHCELHNVALLYLVMEYAGENLSQILPQRPLTPQETRDVIHHRRVYVALHRLRSDPTNRCPIRALTVRLRPASPVPLAPASVAPATQSYSVPPRPAIKPPKKTAPRRSISLPNFALPKFTLPKFTFPNFALPNFALPLLAAVLVIAGIITVPKLLSRRPEPQKTSSLASENSGPTPRVQPKPAKASTSPHSAPSMPRSTHQPAPKPLKTASERQPVKKEDVAAAPEPSPLSARPEEQPKASVAEVVPGEVLNEILPDVSQKARETIRGRVRVSVKVNVDSAGDLACAELDSPDPSKYFAGLALQATRQWEFAPAKGAGSSVSTDWVVRFGFSPLDTKG